MPDTMLHSWLDNYPTWKILAPPLITGSVTALMASMAYFVARSQRTIAKNKYDLDLFDKRYEIFNSMIEIRDKINKLEIPIYNQNTFIDADKNKEKSDEFSKKQSKNMEFIRNFTINEFKDISTKLEKASRIFGEIRKEDVGKFKNTLSDFEIKKIRYLKNFKKKLTIA